MTKEQVLQSITTPLTAPTIPEGRYHFRNREYVYIVYETDPDMLREVVPEPLELSGPPLVRFEIMKMTETTGLGPYCECGQVIPVTFQEERGDYLHMMFLDHFAATAAGRERSGYPKKLGYPKLFVDDDTLIGTCEIGNSRQRVATATMTYKTVPLDPEEARRQLGDPYFMLKLHRNYDKKLRVAEIIRCQTTEIEILEAYTGRARLELFQHVYAPMADLPVKKIVSCSHMIANVYLDPGRKVYDYLENDV